jgi:hypothetical protein
MTDLASWYIISIARQDNTVYEVNVLANSKPELVSIMSEPDFVDPGHYVVQIRRAGSKADYWKLYGIDGEQDL